MEISFLHEWCYQALTQKQALSRMDVWRLFQSHTDVELARSLQTDNSPYSLEQITVAVGKLRIVNAGDLGEFALFGLGGGNLPLRTNDLTPKRRDFLLKLELIALDSRRQAGSETSAIEQLAAMLQPNAPSSLEELAKKYDVTVSYLEGLTSNEPTATTNVKAGAGVPEMATIACFADDEQSEARRMTQVCRLLSMSQA